MAYHSLDGDNSNIYIFSKSSLWYPRELGLDFQRQLLHELSHAQDLNPIHGLKLSTKENLSQFENFGINSSENAFEAKEDQKYEEVIADAVSMVVYKNIPDKSTATIKVPRFNENGKHVGYEVLGYDEWHERFNDLAMWLEKELNL